MPKFKKRRGARTITTFLKQAAYSRAHRGAAVAAARGINAAARGLQLNAGEFKAIDVSATSVVDTTGAVTCLNGCARGDDIAGRNGRETTMKSIEFRAVVAPTDVTGVEQTARVLLVYDRQANATPLTAVQVLAANNTYAPRNLENRRRFKILFDRTFQIGDRSAAPASMPFAKTIKFYRRLAHPVTYNAGNAGTVADIVTGSLYLITVGTQGAGGAAGSCIFYSRVRFQDK